MGGGPGVHTLEQKLHDSQLRRDIASPAPGRLLIPGRLIEAGRAGLGDGAEKGRVEPYVRRHDDLAGQRADLPTRTSPRGHGSGAISPHCGALGSESAIRVESTRGAAHSSDMTRACFSSQRGRASVCRSARGCSTWQATQAHGAGLQAGTAVAGAPGPRDGSSRGRRLRPYRLDVLRPGPWQHARRRVAKRPTPTQSTCLDYDHDNEANKGGGGEVQDRCLSRACGRGCTGRGRGAGTAPRASGRRRGSRAALPAGCRRPCGSDRPGPAAEMGRCRRDRPSACHRGV
jgi:hypothetical protein